MNARLALTDIVAALKLALPAIPNISDGYAVNYLRDFGTTFPAVWVLAQRAKSQGEDTGGGYSGQFRQHFNVEFVVRCVVKRYSDGTTNAGSALNALMDAVTGALIATQPPGCEVALIVTGTQDGPPSETVLYAAPEE
jgi:hypothetical protein